MPFEITKSGTFDAAHHIEGHKNPDGTPGKCARDHGHTYHITVAVTGREFGNDGFILDYYHLGSWVKRFVDKYDHYDLNTFPCYQGNHQPTAERIAYQLYLYMDALMAEYREKYILPEDTVIAWVEVKETESSSARFIP